MRRGDFIHVKNLLISAVAGKDGWRRAIKQPLKIDVAINVNKRLKRMALSDDIRRTLNYDSLSTEIINKNEKCEADSIDATGLSTLKLIKNYLNPGEWAQIRIAQPKARLLTEAREIELVSNDPDCVIERLKNLHVPVIIGINDLERQYKQEIRLNLEVSRSANTDFFTHELTNKIANYVQSSSFLTIESFVNALAEYIYSQSANFKELVVKAAKPSALNMADFASVQVTRKPSDFHKSSTAESKGKNLVYLAFGTNQGDRLQNIFQSRTELMKRGVYVEQTSAIYQSDPMYFTEQPRFFNGVFKCWTDLDSESLLKVLKEIEYGVFGRVKKFDNGPRPFDLDIILFNNDFIETEKLVVPHKDMLNRAFVLRPLNDVLPLTPDVRYTENLDGGETTVVPLYNKTSKAPDFLELNPQYPQRQSTTIMAIMNATPDSFSDGGELNNISEAASQHIRNGAQILDVGGYSTRPGAAEVSIEEESRRVCSAIDEIRAQQPDVILSVDTFRGPVAEAALQHGANIINDVFSGQLDPTILDVAARYNAPIILSHSRGTPATMKTLTEYPEGVINGIASELRERVNAALMAGCQPWQIILDPGIGFAKTPEQDLEIVRKFNELKHHHLLNDALPTFPWLVGPSRKSFIGNFAGESNAKDRAAGTLAVLTALRQQGADILRIHDTAQASQALKLADLIYNY